MSSLALPPLAQAQASLDPRAHWITPKEQFVRLHLIAAEITRLSLLIFDVAQLVEQYVVGDPDDWVTNWYTAQQRLNSLPEKIPPLPENIYQIMNSNCPIYDNPPKDDVTAYKIKDTHFLSLVSETFGNVNRLERDILKPYGEREYSKENPLQFHCFVRAIRLPHADVPFPDTHWILMTKDILPGSRKKTWDQQVALINALRQKTSADYEMPTLQQSFAGITTDMVATGERRYQAGNDENRNVFTYTVVKEMTRDVHLIVGGYTRTGVQVEYTDGYRGEDYIGIAALRQF